MIRNNSFIYINYICLTFVLTKNLKQFHKRVFKITDFNNLQQETTKGTLRPYDILKIQISKKLRYSTIFFLITA